MKIIYKYELAIKDRQLIEMPTNAQLLSVQLQKGQLCLWALVDPEEPVLNRDFLVLGTGHLIKDRGLLTAIDNGCLDHIDTVQDGPLVWHIFENTLPF